MANNNLHPQQFEQLRMFAPAREIKDAIDSGKIRTGDNELESGTIPLSQMWSIKRREARMEGLDKQIQSEGVKRPLHIFHDPDGEPKGPHLWDGHHRLIVAYDKDPNTEVPLGHNDEATYTQWLNTWKRGDKSLV